MSRNLLLVFLTFGAMLLGASAAQAETIRCESQGGRYQVCSADTRGGVLLSQQLSSQGCWQNDTWGYDRDRIWVDRGCRAEFKVGGGSHSSSKDNAVAAALVIGLAAAAVAADKHNDHHSNNNYNQNDYNNYSYHDDNRYGYGGNPRSTFRCESRDDRFTYCNIPYRGHVEVYKQRSSSPCTHGRSWGAEGNRLWVSDGCRADFAIY
jgi:hypothetical protein